MFRPRTISRTARISCRPLAMNTAPQVVSPAGMLTEAAVLMATAPKSNSAHNAIIAAMEDVRRGRTGDIPRHLKNVHADSAGAERGPGYRYPHDFPNHYVAQQYLPDELKDRVYYRFGRNRTEQAAREYRERLLREADGKAEP